MFELTSLQLFHALELHLGYVVSVHIHQDVLDHHDTQLLVLPHLIYFLQQVFFIAVKQPFTNRLKQLNGSILDTVVQEVAVLVQYQTVCGTVKLFIAERTRLLLVYLVDGLLNGVPVLQCLFLRPVSVAHSVVFCDKFLLRGLM